MLCLFKTLALGLFSDPGPVENALQTRARTHTHCVLSLRSIWCSCNSSCCYTIHPQSTLLDATVGLVVFLVWGLQPVCFPKLFAGWLLRMGLCLFDWICRSRCYPTLLCDVHQTACNSALDSSLKRTLPAQNWLTYSLNGGCAVCAAPT